MSIILEQKKQLRQKYRKLRDSLSPEMRKDWSRHIGMQFHHYNWPSLSNHCVAGYLPVRSEADPLPILADYAQNGHRTALPLLPLQKDAPMVFATWKPGDSLIPSPVGIVYQPGENAPLIDPDIILVPLLAFDRKGYRIGYGGGYYDRTLALYRYKNPKLLAVGIAFSCQETNSIPTEPHDQKLDFLITERDLFAFNRGV